MLHLGWQVNTLRTFCPHSRRLHKMPASSPPHHLWSCNASATCKFWASRGIYQRQSLLIAQNLQSWIQRRKFQIGLWEAERYLNCITFINRCFYGFAACVTLLISCCTVSTIWNRIYNSWFDVHCLLRLIGRLFGEIGGTSWVNIYSVSSEKL